MPIFIYGPLRCSVDCRKHLSHKGKGNKMEAENQFSLLLESLVFPKIFKSFRMAVQPGKILVAFSALVALALFGRVMDLSKTVVTMPNLTVTRLGSVPETGIFPAAYPSELQCYLAEPRSVKKFIQEYSGAGARIGLFSTLWHFGSTRFTDTVFALFELNLHEVFANIGYAARAIIWALQYHTLYSIVYFGVALVVIAVAGGGICRMAAMQLARDETIGPTEAARFGLKKFISLLTAPLIPVGIIFLLGLLVFILGLIGNLPWAGEIIIGICLIIALFVGLLITLVLIGAIGGVNLMYPAIAYEASDGFDAVSRAFGYIYARPWRMVFCTVLAAFYGGASYLFVRFFAFLLLFVTHLFLQLGVRVEGSTEGLNKLAAIWPEPTFLNLLGSRAQVAQNWSESGASFLVYLALLIVFGLLVSFVISFYFSANTIIYALLRNKVDKSPINEISADFEEVPAEQEPVESQN
jgi:hypothetical protein